MSEPTEMTALRECPVCGAIGLAERIENHDCRAFLARREEAHR